MTADRIGVSELRQKAREEAWTLVDPAITTWEALCPNQVVNEEPLASIAKILSDPEALRELNEDEERGEYLERTLKRLRDANVLSILAQPKDARPTMTMHHVCALNVLSARKNGSLAITLGKTPLALLPTYIGATAEQIDWIFSNVHEGNLGSLLLTELGHGSNLLQNECIAERGTFKGGVFARDPEGGHYRINGEKDLINGGTKHGLLCAFVRTREGAPTKSSLEARGDFSLFVIPRDNSIEALPRWQTLPMNAADIAGVRFRNTIVSVEQRLGAEGDGFGLVQKTLIVSRGGIGALASGAASGALHQTLSYAKTRAIYGPPIITLPPVAEHLARMFALELVIAATSVKAACAVNAQGLAASHLTAVAKYLCPTLAEEVVQEGRKVLGARALLRDFPYERHIRDVLLYAIFDGTTHLMLDQIAWRLAQLAVQRGQPTNEDAIASMRVIYAEPPRSLVESTRTTGRAKVFPLESYLEKLASIAPESFAPFAKTLTTTLINVAIDARARNRWDKEAGVAAAAGHAFALLEGLVATLELSDPVLRVALGMENVPIDEAVHHFACAWLSLRIASQIHEVAALAGASVGEQTDRSFVADPSFTEKLSAARRAILEAIAK